MLEICLFKLYWFSTYFLKVTLSDRLDTKAIKNEKKETYSVPLPANACAFGYITMWGAFKPTSTAIYDEIMLHFNNVYNF